MRMHSLNTILSAFLLLDTCHFNKAATDYEETPNPKLRGSSRKMQSLISPTSTDNYNSFNDPGTDNTDALRVDGDSNIMIEEDNTFMEGHEDQSFLFYSEEDNHDHALYKDNMMMMGDNPSNTEYDDNEVLPLQEDKDEADDKELLQYPEEMIPADLEADNEELYEINSAMMNDKYDSNEVLPVQEQYEEEVYDEKQFMQYPEEMISADLEADNEELYEINSAMVKDEYDSYEALPVQEEQYEEEVYDEKQFMQYPEEMIPADLEADNEELYEINSAMMKDEYDSNEALPVQEQYEEEVYDEKQFLQYPEEMIPADLEADNEELYEINSAMMNDKYDSNEVLPVQEQYEEEVYDEKQFMQYPEEMIPADLEADNEELYEINSAMMKDEYDSYEALPVQEEQYDDEAYDEKQFLQYPEEMIPADFETDNEELYEINSAMMKDEYDSYEAFPLQEEQYEEEVYDEKQFMQYPEEMIPADFEADNEELYDNNSGTMMDEMQDQLIFP